MKKQLRLGAFGFHSIPPRTGSAGSDKFAFELYPRMIKRGCNVVAYSRYYAKPEVKEDSFLGIKIFNIQTVNVSGFDTLLHSLKCTMHIILRNTCDVVHIHNGGNSIWGLLLRVSGKKVVITQDGIDWKRDKWKWYGKFFLYISTYLTAYIPHKVVFDNIYTKEIFEKKFDKRFDFIPYGSEVKMPDQSDILNRLNLKAKEYFLFVGRFIPDKGLQYLIPAFEKVSTDMRLVIVGGAPIDKEFEQNLKSTNDQRIIFPGYIYGDDATYLMMNAYCYIQPSDVEGLSPVLLQVMGLGVLVICSDIKENIFLVENKATLFKKGNINSLAEALNGILRDSVGSAKNAVSLQEQTLKKFSWDRITLDYLKCFTELL